MSASASPPSTRSASASRRAPSAAAWSPAPAMPAASSPPPTPRAMRCGSPTISRRAWRSTCRSTSTSPAATIPAPSTTSATSACWPPRSIAARTASRAITSISAAVRPRPPSRRWRASMRKSVAFDDLPPLLERLLAAWLAHRAAPTESFFEFCRRHEVAALRDLADARRCGARGMNAITPIPSIIPENAPFSSEQRAWLNGFFAAYLGVSGEAVGRGRCRRRTGRGFPLARRGAGDARAAGARQGRASPSASSWPPWPSSIAASAAISARPMPRPCGPAPRPTWAAACRAARRPSAS